MGANGVARVVDSLTETALVVWLIGRFGYSGELLRHAVGGRRGLEHEVRRIG